jgi:hypothetical protein
VIETRAAVREKRMALADDVLDGAVEKFAVALQCEARRHAQVDAHAAGVGLQAGAARLRLSSSLSSATLLESSWRAGSSRRHRPADLADQLVQALVSRSMRLSSR